LGRPLNDNIESWEVSHFELKDHTISNAGWEVLMRGLFFVIHFSNKCAAHLKCLQLLQFF
jgi:hypothetical protein